MRIVRVITLILFLFTSIAAVARPWTPEDDVILGIPSPNSVQIQLVSSDHGHLRILFTNPDVKKEQVTANKQDWTLFTMDGETRTWEQGKPAVPVISRPILLPNKGNVKLRVVSSNYTEYTNIDVLPQQHTPEESTEGYVEYPFAMDNDFYQQDRWYPEQVAELGEPAICRDARTALLAIQPVQVNPRTRTVRVYTSIEVETVPIGGTGINEILDPIQRPAPGFAQFYRDIIGADELAELNATAMPGAMMLICRPDSGVVQTLRPYVEWRNRSGRTTQVVMTTATTPSALRDIILNAYNTWPSSLEYVQLVGDGGESGSYMLPSYSTIGYTDHDMVRLVGNDPIADVFISRWTCDNAQDLATQVYRTYNYERTPNMGSTGADTSWFRRGWGYAGTGYNMTSNPTGVRFCLEMMKVRGVPQSGLYYAEHSGGVDDALIRARVNPGLLFWAHRASYIGQISPTNVSSLTNTNKCFLSANITCGTGEWYGASSGISETLIRNGTPAAPAGALTAISTQTGGTHPAHNICTLTGCYYGLGVKNAQYAAGLYYEAKFQLWRNFWGFGGDTTQASNFIHWNNVMGDVSVRIWTGVPRRISANIPQSLTRGQNILPVTIYQQNTTVPIEGALVTAYKTNSTGSIETFARMRSNASGQVSLSLSNLTTGNLYVTVVGDKVGMNLVPIIDTVSIVTSASDLTFSGYAIVDNSQDGRVGNSDNNANPGETVDLNIRLQNSGISAAVTNISATLESGNPFAIAAPTSVTYRNLPAGDSAYGNSMFRIRLLNGLLDNDIIPLTLNVAYGDTNHRAISIILPIKSMRLQYLSSTLSPTIISAGDTASIWLTFRNIGNLATNTTNSVMFAYSPLISILQSDVVYPALPIGNNVTTPLIHPYKIICDEALSAGSVVTLGVVFNAGAANDTLKFAIRVGSRTSHDPCGPDAYGYMAFDESDVNYPEHPTFSWQNIETSARRLSLSDPSEGSDQTMLYRLPFRAKYYGQFYDTIMINTNAWMAFGVSRVCDSLTNGSSMQYESSLYTNFRNWRLPAQEGPRNLVAVGWQDLVISSSPDGVYAYNDVTNGWFVITWKGSNLSQPGTNSVQLLIMDPTRYPTPTGDCKLLMQIKDFSGNVSSYPPDVNYATVGIEDSTRTRALEYVYWDSPNSGAIAMPNSATTNLNRAILFTTLASAASGTLEGTVTYSSNSQPVANSSILVLNGGYSAITDSNGHYQINNIQIGTCAVRVSKFGHNTATSQVTITLNTVSTLNFQLTKPELQISLMPQDTALRPNDSLWAVLTPQNQDTTMHVYVRNTGNGPLSCDIELISPQTVSLWERQFSFDASQVVGGDQQLSGVEFDGNNFWISGATNGYARPHKLYKVDHTGTQLLATYDCPDPTSLFGWRDLAWDGHYLYGSYTNHIDKIDTANGQVVAQYPITSISLARGIAIDTAAGIMYYAEQNSAIYKMRLSDGTITGSVTSPQGLFGLGWFPSDPDGKPLYAFCRDSSSRSRNNRIFKINPTTGETMTAVRIGSTLENAMGLAITPRWNPMTWSVIGLLDTPSGNDHITINQLSVNLTWVNYSPSTLTLPPNSADSIRVSLTSRSLPLYRYAVALRFTTNAVTQVVTIPVVMLMEDSLQVQSNERIIPKNYSLEQNYPNPFNPITTISFTLPRTSKVNLSIYNELGQEIARLLSDRSLHAGKHTIQFDGSRLATGIYFYQIEAGSFISTRKMALIK